MDGWGNKVAILPDHGTLLFATDLQGNLDDYRTLVDLYEREDESGKQPVLLLCGDLVHGPDASLQDPEDWPEHLGTFYLDRSRELLLDYERFAARARTLCLLGNHEHAHIGGPVVAKFHADEAAVLERALGEHTERMRAFFRTFPLVAAAPCGAVFTHGAPYRTEPNLASFARLDYAGYERCSFQNMHALDTVGALLWARRASAEQARALLEATSVGGRPGAFVAFGHDIVRKGYQKIGPEQICLSTSYGLFDRHKVYLRLDLARRYRSVDDLREGVEIRTLYPAT